MENLEQTMLAFMEGDKQAIVAMGNKALVANNADTISPDKIDEFVSGWQPEYITAIGEGAGMSTMDALRCLFDLERTSLFVKAIVNKVSTLKQQFPDQEIHIVDAGSGTGILSIAAALAGAHVTAIEINEDTATFSRKFISELGLEDKINVIVADARKIEIGSTVHGIISENMHTGLFYEWQIQILEHLKKYLVKGGVLIPDGVVMQCIPVYIDKDLWPEGKTDTEAANIGSSNIEGFDYSHMQTVEVDFMAPNLEEQIMALIPVNPKLGEVNGFAIKMAVVVSEADGVVLYPDEGKFLGTTHLVKIEALNQFGHIGKVTYQAGYYPPSKMELIGD